MKQSSIINHHIINQLTKNTYNLVHKIVIVLVLRRPNTSGFGHHHSLGQCKDLQQCISKLYCIIALDIFSKNILY